MAPNCIGMATRTSATWPFLMDSASCEARVRGGVLISDEIPVDEDRRDRLLEAFQTRHAGADLEADPDEEPEEYEEEAEELGRE